MNDFFKNSELLDYLVLRPLVHIKENWELTSDSDTEGYEEEENSFSSELNYLIEELGRTTIPQRYHDNENLLARYVKENSNIEIKKYGERWVGADYKIILQEGGFDDVDEFNLVQSAVGRIDEAKKRNQLHFDEMEKRHQYMLAIILTLIIYHRFNGNKK